MKKTYFLLTALFLAISICMNAQSAQETLSKLTFEAPTALYHAKNYSANLRQQPNMKARKVNVFTPGGEPWIGDNYLVNDEGDNAMWITTQINGKKVFISKGVMQRVEPQPFMVNKVQNDPFCWSTHNEYDEPGNQDMIWRIGKVKGNSSFWLCQTIEYNGVKTLRLGKMTGNVLVFKYCIDFYNDYNWYKLEGVNKWTMKAEIETEGLFKGRKQYWLETSQDFKFQKHYYLQSGGEMSYEDIDLTKFTEPMVYALFKDVIDRGETNYFYLTSYSFDKKWNP